MREMERPPGIFLVFDFPVSEPFRCAFQEQDSDLRPVRGDRPGCLPLLLPRHGRRPQNVPPQVSKAPQTLPLSPPVYLLDSASPPSTCSSFARGAGSVSHPAFVCFPGPTGGSAPSLTPCSSSSMMKSVS